MPHVEVDLVRVAEGPLTWITLAILIFLGGLFTVLAVVFVLRPDKALAWSYPGETGRRLRARMSASRVARQRLIAPAVCATLGIALLAAGAVSLMSGG